MATHTRLFALARWAVILLFATLSSTQTQDNLQWENGVTERWWVDSATFTKPHLNDAIERWNLIQAENQSAKSNEWAGDYFSGDDTHGTYLRWSQRAGFVMAHVNKCEASLMGLSYGRVLASPSSLEFIFEFNKSSGSHGHNNPHAPAPTVIKFVPVRWSNDQYLIQENEIAEFGDFVAGLGKYNQELAWIDGIQFFARGEAQSNYDELPQVPPGYERFIRRPIDAAIIAVAGSFVRHVKESENPWWNELITPVTLNVGRPDGVKHGMTFHIRGSEAGETVKVTLVGKHSSEGIIVRYVRKRPGLKLNEWDDGVDDPDPVISIGWKLSTRLHK